VLEVDIEADIGMEVDIDIGIDVDIETDIRIDVDIEVGAGIDIEVDIGVDCARSKQVVREPGCWSIARSRLRQSSIFSSVNSFLNMDLFFRFLCGRFLCPWF
jgi:hypothetical protein